MLEKSNLSPSHRDSNLELFRCITMLLIIAHHYVVNSGLLAADGPVWKEVCSWRSLFLLCFGAFGKTGINCFVLITGYYMCQSVITARKYFKLLAEIYFYKIVIASIFVLIGYQTVTPKYIVWLLLPFMTIDKYFVECFIIFYLFIPFLTIVVKHITIKQHAYLVALCVIIYTICEQLPYIQVSIHYVSWFIVLFFIASFLRLHMGKYMKKQNNIWTIGGVFLTIIVDILSIILIAFLSIRYPLLSRLEYIFVGESNMLLPVVTGVVAFVFFKKMKLHYIPLINVIGGSTFGILLIHAHSNTMRKWLWKDLLHNVEMYSSPWLIVHAIGSVLVIFFVCVAIDRLRIRFIEPPIMACFDKLWPSVVRRYSCFENWFAKMTHCFWGE